MAKFVYDKAQVLRYLREIKNYDPEYAEEYFEHDAARFFNREANGMWSLLDTEDPADMDRVVSGVRDDLFSYESRLNSVKNSSSFSGKDSDKVYPVISPVQLQETIDRLEVIVPNLDDWKDKDIVSAALLVLKKQLNMRVGEVNYISGTKYRDVLKSDSVEVSPKNPGVKEYIKVPEEPFVFTDLDHLDPAHLQDKLVEENKHKIIPVQVECKETFTKDGVEYVKGKLYDCYTVHEGDVFVSSERGIRVFSNRGDTSNSNYVWNRFYGESFYHGWVVPIGAINSKGYGPERDRMPLLLEKRGSFSVGSADFTKGLTYRMDDSSKWKGSVQSDDGQLIEFDIRPESENYFLKYFKILGVISEPKRG